MLTLWLLIAAPRALAQDDAVVEPAVVEPAPATPALPDPAKLREYQRSHLRRGASQQTIGVFPTSPAAGGVAITTGYVFTMDTWRVFDGGGTPYLPRDFAELTGDLATGSKLTRQRKATWISAGLMAGAGVPMMVAGGIRADREIGDAVNPGLGLLVGGFLLTGFSVLPPFGIYLYQADTASVYSPAEADRWIEQYNSALRARLGLSEQDVLGIDLQSRAPRLTVQPMLALAGVGLRGTF